MTNHMTLKEYILQQMQILNIQPKKALGQNFLIGEDVVKKIISKVNELKPKTLIEIGPGLGSLTYFLRQIPNIHYTVIELDHNFSNYWKNEKLNVIEGDALKIQFQELIPNVNETDLLPAVLVSNLPYQISSSIVIERCLDIRPLQAMVLMFQKEVAQKIRGRVGDELYGMLSVVAQTFWDIQTICEAGSREFMPAPKVSSRVLVFTSKTSPVKDKKKYLNFVKACYSQPRKLLVKNLESSFGASKEKSIQYLLQIKKTEKARAEELSVAEMIDFYHFLI